MGESQGLISARTDELRGTAQRFAEAGRSIQDASELTLPMGALDGTALQAAIEYAQQRICESLQEHSQRVDRAGSSIRQSARNYDDGDSAFAASIAVPIVDGP